MAGENLTIQQSGARVGVFGKCKADTYIDSGIGLDLEDIDIGSLDSLDIDWEQDVDDPDNLPDEIRIITPPTKTEYKDGEKLNLDGMVVGAYKEGVIWTSAKYPNGHIPLGELLITPLVLAEAECIPNCYAYGGVIYTTGSFTGRYDGRTPAESYTETFYPAIEDSKTAVLLYDHGSYVLRHVLTAWREDTYKSKLFDCTVVYDDGSVLQTSVTTGSNYSVTYNGTYICRRASGTINVDTTSVPEIPANNQTNVKNIVLKMFLDDSGEFADDEDRDRVCTIGISWARPSDGVILSTNFTVTVKKKETTGGNGGR